MVLDEVGESQEPKDGGQLGRHTRAVPSIPNQAVCVRVGGRCWSSTEPGVGTRLLVRVFKMWTRERKRWGGGGGSMAAGDSQKPKDSGQLGATRAPHFRSHQAVCRWSKASLEQGHPRRWEGTLS